MAALAQLGERQTEDLKAPCSIHGGGISFSLHQLFVLHNLLAIIILQTRFSDEISTISLRS